MSENEPKVILLHGCSKEDIQTILGSLRKAFGDRYGDIAFCTSTPTNLDWKLKDIVADVWEEHEYMRNNPPGE